MHDTLSLLVAMTVTAALLHGLRPIAQRLGLVDIPGARKVHAGDVPLIGGLAMFFGFAIGVLTLDVGLTQLRPFFAACSLLVFVGLLDDLHELSSRARFAAQILAASLMAGWGGVLLTDLGALAPGGGVSALGVLAVPFSVFCAVGVINALNMSDGADGLAGGLSLIALAGLAWIAHAADRVADREVLGVLVAVVAVFLAVNARLPWRPRALVFMGDAGSMFLGFAITWFFIDLSQGPQRVMAPVSALWLLMVPLFDTVWLLIRRPLSRRWPTAASHDHLHHVLQMAGLTPGRTVAAILALAVMGAGVGLWGHTAAIPERYMFWGFLAAFAAYALVMGTAWHRQRLLAWPLDRRLGETDRRQAAQRRGGERRTREDRRGGPERRATRASTGADRSPPGAR